MHFISMYSALNTFSEYTYFYISKNITSYTFLLVFKVERFQCILKESLYVSNLDPIHSEVQVKLGKNYKEADDTERKWLMYSVWLMAQNCDWWVNLNSLLFVFTSYLKNSQFKLLSSNILTQFKLLSPNISTQFKLLSPNILTHHQGSK